MKRLCIIAGVLLSVLLPFACTTHIPLTEESLDLSDASLYEDTNYKTVEELISSQKAGVFRIGTMLFKSNTAYPTTEDDYDLIYPISFKQPVTAVQTVEEAEYKGILFIDADGTYYVKHDSENWEGNRLVKTKDFISFTFLHDFDTTIIDARVLDDGELLVTLDDDVHYKFPFWSVNTNVIIDNPQDNNQTKFFWGTEGGINKIGDPYLPDAPDSDSNGIADNLVVLNGCTDVSIDSEGQHFTPAAIYDGLITSHVVVRDHKYYVTALVKSTSSSTYLQATDYVQYVTDYHSGSGEWEWLAVEITADKATTSIGISVSNNGASSWSEIIWKGLISVDVTENYPAGGEMSLDEFVSWIPDGITNYNGIWKSSNNQTEFNQVVKLSSRMSIAEPEWGLSSYRNHVLFCEYGAIMYNTGYKPTFTFSNYIWYSDDYGVTWSKKFDSRNAPEGFFDSPETYRGFHLHGCVYDQYWDRFWAWSGDNDGTRTLMWSDDFGETWERIETSAYEPLDGNILQALSAIVLPHCILFTHDSTFDQGIYRVIRREKDEVPIIEMAYDFGPFPAVKPTAPTHFGRKIVRSEDLILFPFSCGGIDYGDNQSFIIGSYDGFHFFEVWKNEYESLTGDTMMRLRVDKEKYYIDIGDSRTPGRKSYYEGYFRELF